MPEMKGGGGGRGGLGGSGGKAGRAGRAGARAAGRAARNSSRSANRAAKRQTNASQSEAAAIDAKVDNILKNIGSMANNAGGRVRSIVKKFRKIQVKNRAFGSKGAQRMANNKMVAREIDNFAGDVVKSEYFKIGDMVTNQAAGSHTRNGIFSALRPGQNGLLQRHAGPTIEKGFRDGLSRESILREALRSHDAMEEALGVTIRDLVNLGQNVRDAFSPLFDGNDN